MIVRCANCHTEFSLDEHQIGPEGATVRCSVCSYVFPVDPPPGAGDHPWQIRTVEDLLFTAPDLVTLRTWIAEGRLHPDDQVSRTGRHWIRLGDMPEFSSAFSGFSDLPPVFMELETTTPASPYGSALEELGPPPGFGETMPVIQGVDTDILVVRPESIGDFEVPVTARSAAVERALERPGGPVPEPVSPLGETSQPMPFPLAELPGALDDDDDDDDEPERSDVDESAVRMRPRPPRSRPDAPTARVSAVPDVVEDVPVQSVRRRSTKATVRYGADEVHGASMLDAVTSAVDSGSGESSAVRSTAAAIERVAGRDDGPSEVRPRAARSADGERRRDRNADSEEDESSIKLRRRHRTFARDVGAKPARRTWPLVAALGVLAGVGVIFGVPSIRARVMGLAGGIAGGEERFDPASLTELTKAQAAVASLDPVALGQAEAALQGRLDEGEVPPAGIAEMKLAQAELLATRALDHAVGSVIGAAAVPSDDVDRATAILAGVVAEDVIDRAHMRRVRARLRLVQGRPAAEILPLLPEDGSGELRQLVEAAPLWRDAAAPVPDGVIAGLESLEGRSALCELVLGVAYLRAGDRSGAAGAAQAVLTRVPQQPTALRLAALASGTAADPASDGSGSGAEAAEGGAAAEGAAAEGAAAEGAAAEGTGGPEVAAGSTGGGDPGPSDTKAPGDGPKPSGDAKSVKLESVDTLIEKGCNEVESGDVDAGLDLLRKAKSRRPGDLDMLLCTGEGHAKQGRTEQALTAYEAALRRSPSFAAALREAAKAADKLGDSDKALRYYRRLLAQRPGDAAARAYVEAHG